MMRKPLIYVAGILLLFSLCFVLPATAFTLTSPNGGENWQAGTTHTISWTRSALDFTDAQINLYERSCGRLPSGIPFCIDVFKKTITPHASIHSGSYSWYIPTDQAPGTSYKIELKSNSLASNYDRSDGYFTIAGLRITSPNGGETWTRGTSQRIKWYQAGLTGTNVKLDLLTYGPIVLPGHPPSRSPITSSVSAAQGYYDWTPAVRPPGNYLMQSYQVEVRSLSNSQLGDMSDARFYLQDPSSSATIKVTSPTCSVIWQPGTTHTVTWTSTGNVGPNVKIQLLNNNVVVGTAIESTPNDGSFDWTISSTRAPGTNYQIQVTSTTTGVKGTSCVFTIGQPNPTQASIVVTSPKAGDSWQRGTTHQVTWTSTGAVGPNVKIELWQGSTLAGTAAPSTENDGSYLWTISSTRAPGTYWIKVTSLTTGISGKSGDFTITA
jgi:hypothetical protein